jgi:hypothetical protein
MDAAIRFDTQIVGALPVITEYVERLRLADHINELVPWEGEVHFAAARRATVTEIHLPLRAGRSVARSSRYPSSLSATFWRRRNGAGRARTPSVGSKCS